MFLLNIALTLIFILNYVTLNFSSWFAWNHTDLIRDKGETEKRKRVMKRINKGEFPTYRTRFLELWKILINCRGYYCDITHRNKQKRVAYINRLIPNMPKLRKINSDLPVLNPLVLRCPAHFQLARASCAVMQSHSYFGSLSPHCWVILFQHQTDSSSQLLHNCWSSSVLVSDPDLLMGVTAALARAHSSPHLTSSLFAS